MNDELDGLKTDNEDMYKEIMKLQKQLQELELKIGFEFGNDPMELYRTKPGLR